MSTSQEIMDDAKTRYRHIYDDPTIIGWLNTVHKRVYKMVPRDQLPAVITLNKAGVYPLPQGIKRRFIKRVTFGTASGSFRPLEYTELQENLNYDNYFLADKFIFIVEPEDTDNTYMVMIYYDKTIPTTITAENLEDPPDLDEEYHEVLTVGLLEMIAGARKDIKMKNNYSAEYRDLLGDFLMESTSEEPDYPSCRDDMPRRARYGSSVEE